MFRYLKLLPDFIIQPLTVKHLPVHLQIEITQACNMHCIMCPREGLIKKPSEMTFDAFKSIYDQIKPLKINLSGLGEPLMNRDIFKMAFYAHKYGSAVNLPSNFTLAGKYLDEIIGSGISQIKVSIDAASRETYFKIRGADKFFDIVDSISKLNDIKAKSGITKPEIRFNFALQKENIHELIDIINLASHLKVKTIFFQYMEFVGMEDRKINLIGGMNILKLRKQLIDAAKLAERKRINSNLSVWLTDLNLYANKMKPIENFKPNHRRCYFPWFSTFIEANGDVKPCPVVGWIKNEGKMGNAFEEKFVDIWNNTSYGQIRRALKKGCRPFIPCKTCIPHKLSSIFYIFSKMLPKN